MYYKTMYEQNIEFNIEIGERTINNTPKRIYNCGGFALNTFGWYYPFSEEDAEEIMDMFFYDEVDDSIANMFVKYMLDTIPQLRLIDSIKDLKNNEYAIAFRTSTDDFHFMKRGKNGMWYEKCGAEEFISVVPKEEVFSCHWHHRYYGKLYLFAKKG